MKNSRVDCVCEIEKAEDMAANKPLYAERMRNKRALDRADQKVAADAEQVRVDAEKALKDAAKKKTALEKRRSTKSNKDTATGMSASFTFPTAGTFGFFCEFHFGSGMKGAVFVE